MSQRVAIAGVGITRHTARRPDVNDGELLTLLGVCHSFPAALVA